MCISFCINVMQKHSTEYFQLFSLLASKRVDLKSKQHRNKMNSTNIKKNRKNTKPKLSQLFSLLASRQSCHRTVKAEKGTDSHDDCYSNESRLFTVALNSDEAEPRYGKQCCHSVVSWWSRWLCWCRWLCLWWLPPVRGDVDAFSQSPPPVSADNQQAPITQLVFIDITRSIRSLSTSRTAEIPHIFSGHHHQQLRWDIHANAYPSANST